jgi:hypothetical protein
MGGKSDFPACRVCKEGRGAYGASLFVVFVILWRMSSVFAKKHVAHFNKGGFF